jgi:hypothetical protein
MLAPRFSDPSSASACRRYSLDLQICDMQQRDDAAAVVGWSRSRRRNRQYAASHRADGRFNA